MVSGPHRKCGEVGRRSCGSTEIYGRFSGRTESRWKLTEILTAAWKVDGRSSDHTECCRKFTEGLPAIRNVGGRSPGSMEI